MDEEPLCLPKEKCAKQGPHGRQSKKKITGSIPLRAVERGFGDSNKPRFMHSTCS